MPSFSTPEVLQKFESYPSYIREKLGFLRQLVIDTAAETEGVGPVEETLKWGEPSYAVTGGSPIRMDWKSAAPNQYAMYFQCQTKLVSTFRALYPEDLKFDGNRAIIFDQADIIPTEALQHCISLALRYHTLKHLPSLGA